MKAAINLKMLATLIAILITFMGWGVASAAEFHQPGISCEDCHDFDGAVCNEGLPDEFTNLKYIKCTISTPNSGDKDVVFTTLPDDYADGDTTYDGVCEVCHTKTNHHRNDGSDNTAHYDGQDCMSCHPHCEEFAGPVGQLHATHSNDPKGPNFGGVGEDPGCTGCHLSASGGGVFWDGKDLANTNVCDPCHSPGGAFDGVDDATVGARTNYADGIYEADGTTLKAGKELWCATCHDEDIAPTEPIEIVVDNMNGSPSGTWGTSSWSKGYYGTNYHYHLAGTGGEIFTWQPTIITPGTYEVFACWTQDPSRATDATYTIYHDGVDSPTDKPKDQTKDGGTVGSVKWNSLGTYSFDGVDDYVKLTENPNGIVIADAIRLVSVGGDMGISGPNVVGDNISYGFYKTGHGANGWVECLDCHDASKTHIDGEPRTYEVSGDEGDPGDVVLDVVVNPYCDSYRLKDIGGQCSMNIPRPVYDVGTNPLDNWQDFALCFECHNRNEVVGWNRWAISNTNFRTDASGMNAHYRHVGEFYSKHFDSDWDGFADSSESCITCHNVHGPLTMTMIRRGELIDKSPALNFAYLVYPTGVTATWPFPGPDGDYYVYARWTDGSGRASNAKYTINYDTGTDTIYKSQKTNGGIWNQLKASPYSFVGGNSVVLSGDGADGWIVADAIGWDTDGVLDPNPEIIVDNTSAALTPSDWLSSSWASGYWGTDYQYYVIPSRDTNATVVESVGGSMAWNGKTIVQNGVCNGCHDPSGVSYFRTPFLGPKVLNPKASPESVPADGITTVTLTCTVFDHNNNVTGVTINLSPIGGGTEDMVDQGGGLYSYQTTVSEDTNPGQKLLLVTATALDGTGKNNITLTVAGAGGMAIIDNVDGTANGTWGTSSWAPGYYGEDYRYHEAGSGGDTFHWPITSSGTYEVFARWTSDPSSRAPDATYTIYHDGIDSPTDKSRDQRYFGGEWISLGTFDFDGVDDYVELTENPNGIVVADAIMITPPTETVIVDNPDGTFTGTWNASTWSPGYYGADYQYHVPGSGGDTFTWTPTITTAGTYEVFARWTSNPSRAPNATYTIYHDGVGSPTSVPKDQRSNGGEWVSLGTYSLVAGEVNKVELTENPNGYVIADAVEFVLQ